MAIQNSARALVDEFLREWGLEGLGDWAWNRYKELGGSEVAMATIRLELPDQDAFKARYPAYDELAKAGRAMSVAQIRAYEDFARQTMRAFGIPEGFYDDPSDFARLLVNDVSVNELQQRVSVAAKAAAAPNETRDALQALYGLTEGDLTAFFLDPDKALPLIVRRYEAGALAGSAQRAGFGALNVTEAERLAELGVSEEQAGETFGALVESQEAFGPLAGERDGDFVSRSEQLEGAFGGNAGAAQRIARSRRRRQAAFEGSAGFGLSQDGVAGLTPTG